MDESFLITGSWGKVRDRISIATKDPKKTI
jgi:hypothetical protein